MRRIRFLGKWSLDVKGMGLSSLSSARISNAFALTRMEMQSMERLCRLGLENLNVVFQVSLKSCLYAFNSSLANTLLGDNSPHMFTQISIDVLNL